MAVDQSIIIPVNRKPTTKASIKERLSEITDAEGLMQFLEIDYDNSFMTQHRDELLRRFHGYVILTKPEDWFDYRRCLKNAYCRIQRNLLDRGSKTRSACRGCTSCERR